MKKRKRGKYLMPKTHEQVCERKRLFMKLLEITLDREQREMYGRAVNHCDRWTARIAEKAKRCIGLVLVLFALLLQSGCLENTTTGLGRFIQGGGEFVSGIGKDVIRGSTGYGNER